MLPPEPTRPPGLDAIELVHTNDFAEAGRLRDAGYEPVECAFGQHGSVMGPLMLDHHGTESHREGVAIRACRDLYGARRADPRFVVTGTPDADATLAILALSAAVPAADIPPVFYELVDRHDRDPIGLDLLADAESERLAWFNQQERLTQNVGGFRKALTAMRRVLVDGLQDAQRDRVRRAEMNRRRKAMEGILAVYDRDGLELPQPDDALSHPVRRGEAAVEGAARVLVVQSTVWGFDQWYRLAPVVVSYASRMAKVTIGCPDIDTAERLFGPGGLLTVWPELGEGWGGRETIGGSARGERVGLSVAHDTAAKVLEILRTR
jgi:hypothetical protein